MDLILQRVYENQKLENMKKKSISVKTQGNLKFNEKVTLIRKLAIPDKEVKSFRPDTAIVLIDPNDQKRYL